MSTVVALGHFCEVHGPRLVFYTIRNVQEPQFVSECPDLKFCSGCKAPLLEGLISRWRSKDPCISTVQTVHENNTVQAPLSPLTGGNGNNSGGRGSSSAPLIGNGCTSSPVNGRVTGPHGSKDLKVSTSSQTLSRGINEPIPKQVSNGVGSDTELAGPSSSATPATATRYYCSHSNYDHSHLAHLNTCIARTLSCEVTPSNSVAFTSTDIWVIGTSFSLKDSLARGFSRKYCLVFTFLPQVPSCCQPDIDDSPPARKDKHQTHRNVTERNGVDNQHLRTCPKYKGDRKAPPSRSHAQSLRDEYYSDGDHKGAGYFASSYGPSGYPSLVPHYDYITEEFFNVAKHLQTECDKVFFKEESISPQRALRLSAVLDSGIEGGSSSLGYGYGRACGGPRGVTRSHSTGARSLPLLTENPHVFLDLHEKFAKIPSENQPGPFLDNYESDEEDIEELKKEAIWNVGPTPAASFTFAAYANDSDVIKKLVQLGVDLSKVERKYGTMAFLLKLNYEKDIAPTLRFLSDNGVDSEILGWYLTKNPFILNEDLSNLEKRLDYLRLKKFSPENIDRIINVNPFWLSFSVIRMDRRLGFFQSYFRLNGSQVRKLAVSGPKLITSNLGRVKDVTFKVKEEMGFRTDELKRMLLARPRVWRERPESIWRRFDYLHNTVKFPHEAFILCPDLLLVRESRLKHRIGFLEHVGKAQFDPEKPNYVSFKMIYEGDDSEFAIKVAKSSVLEFNDYMKSL